MPTAARIQVQAPDLSPTYLATTNDRNISRSSVRRNLFSSHLSRRPASSTISDLGPNQNTTHPPTFQSRSQPQPEIRFPSPVHNASLHQMSPPPQAPSPASAFTPPPHLQLQPTMPALTSRYDPSVSPHHPLSPNTASVLFPSSSIVAINPSTGRPILPNIPHLPARLKLSDDDTDADQDQEEADEDHDRSPGQAYLQPNYQNNTGLARPGIDIVAAEYQDELDSERRERERIARMLSEMMARQRHRAKIRDHWSDLRRDRMHLHHTAHHGIGKKPSTASKPSRTRRRIRGAMTTSNKPSTLSPSGFSEDDNDIHHSGLGLDAFPDHDEDVFDVSGAMYPRSDADSGDEFSERWEREREELTGLIMASLRRKLAVAELEMWIYGGYTGPGNGGGDGNLDELDDFGAVGAGVPMGGGGVGVGGVGGGDQDYD